MKKLLIAILSILFLSQCFALVGCKNDCEKGNHDWQVQTTLFESSCIERGRAIFKCSNCDETKEDALEFKQHVYSSEWTHDVDYHYHVCAYCESATTEKLAHNYEGPLCLVCLRNVYAESLTIVIENDYCKVIGVAQGFNRQIVEVPSSQFSLPVKIIGSSAFVMKQTITSLTLPNTITTIEDFAFYGCTQLVNFNSSTELTTIMQNAFASCISLQSFSVGDKTNYIGKNTFQNCSSLTSITFATKNGWAFYDGQTKVMDVDFNTYSPEEIADMLVNDYGNYSLERR